jgi:hypothetical protein
MLKPRWLSLVVLAETLAVGQYLTGYQGGPWGVRVAPVNNRNGRPIVLPTRVIRVGKAGGGVRWIETEGQQECLVCLDDRFEIQEPTGRGDA